VLEYSQQNSFFRYVKVCAAIQKEHVSRDNGMKMHWPIDAVMETLITGVVLIKK
jgi:hypothetical protein